MKDSQKCCKKINFPFFCVEIKVTKIDQASDLQNIATMCDKFPAVQYDGKTFRKIYAVCTCVKTCISKSHDRSHYNKYKQAGVSIY